MLDRRSFLKDSALVGAAALASAGIAGTAVAQEAALPEGLIEEDFAVSLVVREPITDFVAEKDYDVVVVGAGTAGVPAVWGALEEGAKVACLQKEATALANGNGSSGVILQESDAVGILQYKQNWRKEGGYRMNPDLLDLFCNCSGETIMWMLANSHKYGFPPASTSLTVNKYDETNICSVVMNSFGPKPKNNSHIMMTLADAAAEAGADFYYETPAVQLIQDESGAIKGVVAQTAEGYVKFNAAKAVIMAAGDYQNNESLVKRYSPDVVPFGRKQFNRTADGILMCILAGGRMCPVNHAKTMHDMDAMPMMVTGLPFMAVNSKGVRFMNEDIPMASWDLSLQWNKDEEDPGHFIRIFDNDFIAKYGARTSIASMENYIPDYLDDPQGVYPGLIDCHRADTLEELAAELEIPADALVESVAKWNEHCATGLDDEFGLKKDQLKPIDTPPYWACRQWIRCSAINGGVVVDGCCRVLDANDQPIPGLYSVGSGAGNICGGLEWNLAQGGLCCGSYMTMGRYAGIHSVKGALEPSKPASYEETKQYWGK